MRAEKSNPLPRFLGLWCAAVLAAATVFLVHLALRFETVRLGYEVGSAKEEQKKLIEAKRMLAVEAATLRQAVRVEAIASQVLEMDVPDSPHVLLMDEKAHRRTSGRIR